MGRKTKLNKKQKEQHLEHGNKITNNKYYKG